jgi:hypothetical protein
MPDEYERAVDDLLDAIRTYLQRQHDRAPTETAIAAYIKRSAPAAIYQDLRQYPECRTAARHLKRGRTDTTHVLYVMLWGRVNDWPASDRSVDKETSETQHTDTLSPTDKPSKREP